jgi:hypothetical protein
MSTVTVATEGKSTAIVLVRWLQRRVFQVREGGWRSLPGSLGMYLVSAIVVDTVKSASLWEVGR